MGRHRREPQCAGRLYAAVGEQIYERVDGTSTHWRLVYTNPHRFRSESDIRGLTAIVTEQGDEVLLAAIEGVNARVVRIDPRDGGETTELELARFVGDAWKMRVGYVIAAYNDMTRYGEALLIGLEAFIAPGAALADDHRSIDLGYGRVDAGARYLVRHANGGYDLHRIIVAERGAGTPRVATRPSALHCSRARPRSISVATTRTRPRRRTSHWIARGRVATSLGRPP